MLRPDGVFGPLHLVGRGRDLLTTATGEPRVLSESTLRAEVAYFDKRALTSIESDPAEPALARLVGERTGSGFRARVDEEVPHHRDEESLLFQLLDDVTVAVLISGYVLSTVPLPETPPAQAAAMRRNENVCAGWRSGGTIMVGIDETGRPPMVVGPELPTLLPADDPMSWHELPTLPEHGMRRHRRMDAWRTDGTVGVECFFRDTYMSVDGTETAIHEYAVDARVDPDAGVVIEGSADPRVLPWVECPPAADSAGRIADVALSDLRGTVRTTFTGTTTCTHLNDQLRSLAGVRALLPALTEPRIEKRQLRRGGPATP